MTERFAKKRPFAAPPIAKTDRNKPAWEWLWATTISTAGWIF